MKIYKVTFSFADSKPVSLTFDSSMDRTLAIRSVLHGFDHSQLKIETEEYEGEYIDELMGVTS